MALVGNISGSINHNSWIGVSGTLIFANEPDARFPSVSSLGADVSFFVSGSLDSKGGAARHVSLFGGDTHVSGSLTVGSSTVKITTNTVEWLHDTNIYKIFLDGTDLKFYDDTYTSGVTLTELGAATAAAGSANEIQFNDGSNNLTADAQLTFVPQTGAQLGEFKVESLASAPAFSVVPGNGNTTIAGDLAVNGGDITTSAGTFNLIIANATTVNFAQDGTTIDIGSSTGTTSINHNLAVDRNTTLGQTASDTTTVAGSLAVNGTSASSTNKITATETQFQLFPTTVQNLLIGGAATAIDIGAASGTTSINNNLTVDGNTTLGDDVTDTTTVAGSLAVNGTAASSTNKITSTQTTFNLLNDTVTTLNVGGAATTISVGSSASGTTTINHNLAVDGNTTLGDASADTISFNGRVDTDILPETDGLHNLGSEANRWANVYTGDLHLKNDRGDYTLIEEEDMLTIRFNKTGKRYKFLLESVPQFDEEPKLNF